jgi:hypothetical protein
MPQPNDLSRSLVALDHDSTIIAVVELSQSSWLVGGVVPGIERQPRKKAGAEPRTAACRAASLARRGSECEGIVMQHLRQGALDQAAAELTGARVIKVPVVQFRTVVLRQCVRDTRPISDIRPNRGTPSSTKCQAEQAWRAAGSRRNSSLE